MSFNIRMGIPEMEAAWEDLVERHSQETLRADEARFFKKLVKALRFLRENPRHNSLASHEIDTLTRKHGIRIFQSYLENRTPAAGRIFWAYGPDPGDITILAVEPHPESRKQGAYERVKLSFQPLRRKGQSKSPGTNK